MAAALPWARACSPGFMSATDRQKDLLGEVKFPAQEWISPLHYPGAQMSQSVLVTGVFLSLSPTMYHLFSGDHLQSSAGPVHEDSGGLQSSCGFLFHGHSSSLDSAPNRCSISIC